MNKVIFLFIFFLGSICSGQAQTLNEVGEKWNELDYSWQKYLMRNALGMEKTRISPDDLSTIYYWSGVLDYNQGRGQKKLENLKGLYFLQHASRLTFHQIDFVSLEGAEYLNEKTQLQLYNCIVDCPSPTYFDVEKIRNPESKDIFLGDVKIGEQYAPAAKINTNFFAKRAFFWWEHLTSGQKEIVKYICGIDAGQNIDLHNIHLISPFFYTRVISLDLKKLPPEKLQAIDLSFLNILTDLKLLEVRNGHNIRDLDFLGDLTTIETLICNNLGLQSLNGVQRLTKLSALELDISVMLTPISVILTPPGERGY